MKCEHVVAKWYPSIISVFLSVENLKVQMVININKYSHFLWKMNNTIYQCFLPNEEKQTITDNFSIPSDKKKLTVAYESFYLVCVNLNLAVFSNATAFSGECIREREQVSGKGL